MDRREASTRRRRQSKKTWEGTLGGDIPRPSQVIHLTAQRGRLLERCPGKDRFSLGDGHGKSRWFALGKTALAGV
jgi:hypothetical protein